MSSFELQGRRHLKLRRDQIYAEDTKSSSVMRNLFHTGLRSKLKKLTSSVFNISGQSSNTLNESTHNISIDAVFGKPPLQPIKHETRNVDDSKGPIVTKSKLLLTKVNDDVKKVLKTIRFGSKRSAKSKQQDSTATLNGMGSSIHLQQIETLFVLKSVNQLLSVPKPTVVEYTFTYDEPITVPFLSTVRVIDLIRWDYQTWDSMIKHSSQADDGETDFKVLDWKYVELMRNHIKKMEPHDRPKINMFGTKRRLKLPQNRA